MNALNKLITIVCKYRTVLVPISLTITILAATWVSSSLTNIDHRTADLGSRDIVSLELACTVKKASTVISEWSPGAIEAVKESIERDYWFIPAYGIFLLILLAIKKKVFIRTRRKSWDVRALFCGLVLIAMACDFVENIFMMRYLESTYHGVLLFFIPAVVKFAILILTVLVLLMPFTQTLILLRETLQLIRTYFTGIASVAIIYFVLIKLTPGHDVVIQVVEFSGPLYFTIFFLILWAGISWYSSRLVGYVKYDSIAGKTWLWRQENLPRIIGFNAFVSVQAAILALPNLFNLNQSQLLAFVAIQNMLYFVFVNLISAWRGGEKTVASTKSVNLSFWFILIVLSGLYGFILLSRMSLDNEYATRLSVLAMGLYVLQFVGLFLIMERRRKIMQNITPMDGKAYLSLFGVKMLKVSADVQASEKKSFMVFHVFVAVGICAYLIGFNTALVDRMGSLAVTFLSFAMLVGLANILTVLSIAKKINVFFYLFVWAILAASSCDPYEIRVSETANPGFYANRPSSKSFLVNWMNHPRRHTLMEKYCNEGRKFPVYLTIADGGASRSGYWVASVLSALQDTSQTNDRFSDHLFCLAGASGGSVGNAAFYTLLAKDQNEEFLSQSKKLLREDFLSPVIFHWLGSDILQHIFPFLGIDDRAVALEKAMEHFEKKCLDSDMFSKRYSEVADVTGKLPLLFINVTQVQRGQPSVISPVRLADFSKRLDVLGRISKHHEDTVSGDLNFSTAVVMGARFPYVSPAGGIGNEFFVDGGYFDNTGAGIVHEMMQHFTRMNPSDSATYGRDSLYNNLEFRLIYLSNYGSTQEDQPLTRLSNDAAAPLLTVLGTYGSQTDVGTQRLINFISQQDSSRYTEFNLFRENDTLNYPMNWVISEFNLKRMDDRLRELRKQRDFLRVAGIDK